MIEKEKTIDNINEIKNQIQEIWNEISQNDISLLREVWSDKACEEYIKKINDVNNTVDDIMDQLNLLESIWEK